MNSHEHQSLTLLLGEVKGQLGAITELIRHTNQAINQRIDDLGRKLEMQTVAINERINDHKEAVEERLDLQDQRIAAVERRLDGHRSRSRAESAGISTLVPVCIELLKNLFH